MKNMWALLRHIHVVFCTDALSIVAALCGSCWKNFHFRIPSLWIMASSSLESMLVNVQGNVPSAPGLWTLMDKSQFFGYLVAVVGRRAVMCSTGPIGVPPWQSAPVSTAIISSFMHCFWFLPFNFFTSPLAELVCLISLPRFKKICVFVWTAGRQGRREERRERQR